MSLRFSKLPNHRGRNGEERNNFMAAKKKSMMGPSFYRRSGTGHGFGKSPTKPLSGKAASKFRLDTQKAIARQKFREESSPARLKMIEESDRKHGPETEDQRRARSSKAISDHARKIRRNNRNK